MSVPREGYLPPVLASSEHEGRGASGTKIHHLKTSGVRELQNSVHPPVIPLSLENPERVALVGIAKEIYKGRRARRRYLSAEMFGEAGWDILLTLYIAAENRSINVSAAGEASGVPPTTALRWIAWLEHSELIERRRHNFDGRVSYLVLTDRGSLKMDQCLRAMLRIKP